MEGGIGRELRRAESGLILRPPHSSDPRVGPTTQLSHDSTHSHTLHRIAKALGGKSGASPAARVARRMEFVCEYMMALTHLTRDGGLDDKSRASAKRHLEVAAHMEPAVGVRGAPGTTQ